jgi:hypothetical protein
MSRYDAKKDETRHGAVSEEDCYKMAERNRWPLVDIETTNQPILKKDCVFKGDRPFPSPYHETETED